METWLVGESASDVRFPEPTPEMREMTGDEVEELALYLEVGAGDCHYEGQWYRYG
jgi:hypothetical protein